MHRMSLSRKRCQQKKSRAEFVRPRFACIATPGPYAASLAYRALPSLPRAAAPWLSTPQLPRQTKPTSRFPACLTGPRLDSPQHGPPVHTSRRLPNQTLPRRTLPTPSCHAFARLPHLAGTNPCVPRTSHYQTFQTVPRLPCPMLLSKTSPTTGTFLCCCRYRSTCGTGSGGGYCSTCSFVAEPHFQIVDRMPSAV